MMGRWKEKVAKRRRRWRLVGSPWNQDNCIVTSWGLRPGRDIKTGYEFQVGVDGGREPQWQ